MPQGGTDLCAAVQTKEFLVPGDRAVADILWKAVEMAGVPRCGYPLLAQNGKNSGNSIDKSEYLSYNLYMGTIPEGMRNSCPCPFLSEEPRSGSGAGALGLVQTVSID